MEYSHKHSKFVLLVMAGIAVITLFAASYTMFSGRNIKNAAQDNTGAVIDSKSLAVDKKTNSEVLLSSQEKVFVAGGSGASVSYDGFSWKQLTSTLFPTRINHETVFFNGKLYALAGYSYQSSSSVNEVIESTDGITWRTVVANGSAPWPASQFMGIAVFKGKLWILGGGYGTTPTVWSSTDAISWTQVTTGHNSGPYGVINNVAVYDNAMWVKGSMTLWKSTDGINWTDLSQHLPTPIISIPSGNWSTSRKLLSFNNKLWLIGGDAYSTTDGVTWSHTYSGSDLPQSNHLVYTLNNMMYALGSSTINPHSTPTVFYSGDGITWRSRTLTSPPDIGAMAYTDAVLVPRTFGVPDLTISSLTFDQTTTHQSLTSPQVFFTFNVRNNSNMSSTLPAGTYFTLYYSTNGGATYIPISNYALSAPVPFPAQQSISLASETFVSPNMRASLGTYQVKMTADVTGLVQEMNENNNDFLGTLTIVQ